MCSDVVIQAAGLCKHYRIYDRPMARLWALLRNRPDAGRTFHALDDVSFTVQRGETLGVIGRNGSGKSTLLQLLCGTLTPTYGQVTVHGRVAALLELGAGFNPEFTGIENIRLNAAILGLAPDEIESRLEAILAFADIGDFVHQPVKAYSSGMFVRLAFAVVAHVDADVLVVDEALAVGDAFFTQKCMRFLRRFRDAGGTLLFVSHDPGAVVGLCDRALWLEGGRVRALGPAKAITEQYLASRYENDGPVLDPVTPPMSMPESHHGDPTGSVPMALPDGESAFGDGAAWLTGVSLRDDAGQPVTSVHGGEWLRLRLSAVTRQPLVGPIFGFYLKDRLGQVLFGENTCHDLASAGRRIPAGAVFHAEFRFRMPALLAGAYVITAALGSGTQDAHVIHHWIHDALAVQSHSRVLHGLMALPTEMSLSIEPTTGREE